MTETGFIQDGVEHRVDCMIFASGFEVTSDLKRRWGIDTVEGRNGVSIYDHWADGPTSLHGVMTHNFPNMFFTGYIQGGLNSTTTLQFGSQGQHAAYIISQALQRGINAVEPSREAQAAYVQHFHEVELDLSNILQECPPSYFTNEGEKEARWFLFRGYGLGWDAFQKLLRDWREDGNLQGLVLD
jgi:cyclohexanone monooxygenase